MTLVNVLSSLQGTEDSAIAQRALAVFSAIANGLDVERLVIYRQAVQAGFYTDHVKVVLH